VHSPYRSVPPFLNRSGTVRSGPVWTSRTMPTLRSGSTPRGGGWC